MNLLHYLFGLSEVGSVGSIAFGLNTESSDFLLGLFAVFINYEVGECDVGAFFGETQSNLLADATGSTGD